MVRSTLQDLTTEEGAKNPENRGVFRVVVRWLGEMGPGPPQCRRCHHGSKRDLERD